MMNKYEERQRLGAAVPETQFSGSYSILISGGLFFPRSDQQHLAQWIKEAVRQLHQKLKGKTLGSKRNFPNSQSQSYRQFPFN
jgi:hypothetical protein